MERKNSSHVCPDCGRKISSGNWKAHLRQEDYNHGRVRRSCAICGADFALKRMRQIYCSTACQRRSEVQKAFFQRKAERKERLKKPLICAWCGKLFLRPDPHPKRRYCSFGCAQRAHTVHGREARAKYKASKEGKERATIYRGRPRAILRQRFHSAFHEALRRGQLSEPTAFEFLGYTIEDLERHLKGTLRRSMMWEQFLKGELHIDHVVPESWFPWDERHFEWSARLCWALPNLQLMEGSLNTMKSNRYAGDYDSMSMPANDDERWWDILWLDVAVNEASISVPERKRMTRVMMRTQ